ncbi:MAG: tetratricopeptide repeat protein [Gemmataceae bacterium]
MDCRKLAWLAGGVVCLLVGCTRHEPQQFVPQQPPPPPKAPSASKALGNSARDDSTKDSALLDAKPVNCVAFGDYFTELASDTSRATGEREAFAQQAKQAYGRALQIDAKFVPAHIGIGTLNENMGQYEEALSSFRAALQLDVHNIPAYVAIGRVYERMDNRPAALATFKSALGALPKEPVLWFENGKCLGRAKDFEGALGSLKRAAQLRPTNAEYNKNVGLMLARMGRPDEAMPWLLAAKMSEADARYNVAQIMRHIGRLDASQEQVALALRADPEHVPTLKLMSDLRTAPPAADTVRAAAYQEPTPPAAALPTRPPEKRTQMPLIPVLSDNWDARPSPPSLTNPAPRPVAKQRPNVSIGFESNP